MGKTIRKDHYNFDAKAGRDKKKWYKPPGQFKQLRRQQRRAQDHNALRQIDPANPEVEMPIHPQNDTWEWN